MSIVLVTGTNRGLGHAVCQNLLGEGHTIIATARKKNKGKAAVAALQKKFPKAQIHFIKLDINDKNDIKACYKEIKRKFGHIDCLINNAGILFRNSFEETTTKQLTSTLDTNLIGPYLLAQKMIPLLEKSENPQVINVSSQLGSIENGGPEYASYRIAKTAMNSMTKVMSHDLADKNIKVYSVCPGWVHTDMGGKEAPRTPAQGANSILFPFYSKRAKTGGYYQDGKQLKW